jgi:hypothetical protein
MHLNARVSFILYAQNSQISAHLVVSGAEIASIVSVYFFWILIKNTYQRLELTKIKIL